MHNLLKKYLAILAKLTLLRYKPKIVAITGSVGKTSTKEAVAAVLSSKFSVRASSGNYNNEIGLPLTIIGEESGGRNPLLWLWIFFKAKLKLIASNYPQVLVLEMGADRPGDIEYLMNLVGKVDIGVLTDIGISHLEFFANEEALTREKLTLIKKLQKSSTAILNFDNQKIYDNREVTHAKILGFGFSSNTDLQILEFQIISSQNQLGTNFKIRHRGHVVPFFLPGGLGKPSTYAASAAAAVGFEFEIDLSTASEALKKFKAPAGRLHLMDGIHDSWIIDDSYNSAPDSAAAALDTLAAVAPGRKLAALGDMAELGKESEAAHRLVARKIMDHGVACIFLVGPKSKATMDELKKHKFGGKVFWFANSDEAKKNIPEHMIAGDTILIKGSQSMRMEKITRDILRNPSLAQDLLVRQSGKWLPKT